MEAPSYGPPPATVTVRSRRSAAVRHTNVGDEEEEEKEEAVAGHTPPRLRLSVLPPTMRLSLTTVVGGFVAAASSPVSAGPGHPIRARVVPSDSLLRADDVLSLPYESHPPRVLSRRTPLSREDVPVVAAAGAASPSDAANTNTNTNTTTSTTAGKGSAAGTLNATDWDAVTDAACVDALRALPRSTNPSGNCLCYNLPSLDTGSGVFEADLRLYRISAARDAFAGVSPADISVGVSYSGATVTPVSANELMGLGAVENRTRLVVAPRAESQPGDAGAGAGAGAGDGPQLLRKYLFVGQIDKARMERNMSMATIESLILPTFTLSAKDVTGAPISTNVSLNEASFLTGVFSSQVILSDFSAAQVAVDDRLAALRNGTAAFILPGTQLMIFPVGLIITSIWLLLGVAAYAVGTWERVGYADMYKRRVQFETKARSTF
ncbi:C6 zinc finger protein [Purpureocillium lavendulum]|uniref:C6 zinc finger protein n=1 Tax=Purpureocillium lavendulum TaxID=1247861 RepID=A0AB34FWQ9_9HYPO|nr:C6 zinc finger protein [Purpureocillium lavendulum]